MRWDLYTIKEKTIKAILLLFYFFIIDVFIIFSYTNYHEI